MAITNGGKGDKRAGLVTYPGPRRDFPLPKPKLILAPPVRRDFPLPSKPIPVAGPRVRNIGWRGAAPLPSPKPVAQPPLAFAPRQPTPRLYRPPPQGGEPTWGQRFQTAGDVFGMALGAVPRIAGSLASLGPQRTGDIVGRAIAGSELLKPQGRYTHFEPPVSQEVAEGYNRFVSDLEKLLEEIRRALLGG